MALRFNNAVSDVVSHGSDASVDDMNTGTIMLLVYPAVLGVTHRLTYKGVAGSLHTLFIAAGNNITYAIQGAVQFQKTTNDTPTATAKQWYCVAVRYQFGVTGDGIWTAKVGQRLKQSTLGTDAAGLTPGSDAGQNLCIGGNDVSTQSWNGDIAWVGLWNRVLTDKEMNDVYVWAAYKAGLTPVPVPYTPTPSGCVLNSFYGKDGNVAQVDLSPFRNNGTGTGTIAVAPLPVDVDALTLGMM